LSWITFLGGKSVEGLQGLVFGSPPKQYTDLPLQGLTLYGKAFHTAAPCAGKVFAYFRHCTAGLGQQFRAKTCKNCCSKTIGNRKFAKAYRG